MIQHGWSLVLSGVGGGPIPSELLAPLDGGIFEEPDILFDNTARIFTLLVAAKEPSLNKVRGRRWLIFEQIATPIVTFRLTIENHGGVEISDTSGTYRHSFEGIDFDKAANHWRIWAMPPFDILVNGIAGSTFKLERNSSPIRYEERTSLRAHKASRTQ
jgi:hypothetical protein